MSLIVKPKNANVLKPNGKPLSMDGEVLIDVVYWKTKERVGEVEILTQKLKKREDKGVV